MRWIGIWRRRYTPSDPGTIRKNALEAARLAEEKRLRAPEIDAGPAAGAHGADGRRHADAGRPPSHASGLIQPKRHRAPPIDKNPALATHPQVKVIGQGDPGSGSVPG